MPPIYIEDTPYKPQYVEVASSVSTDRGQMLYKEKAKSMSIQSIHYLPNEPQFVNVSPSTYLVLAQDVLAETPEAIKAVRTLYGIEVQLGKSLNINEPLPTGG